MSYLEQRDEWLSQHPDATVKEAWDAGYLQSTNNWCKQKK